MEDVQAIKKFTNIYGVGKYKKRWRLKSSLIFCRAGDGTKMVCNRMQESRGCQKQEGRDYVI